MGIHSPLLSNCQRVFYDNTRLVIVTIKNDDGLWWGTGTRAILRQTHTGVQLYLCTHWWHNLDSDCFTPQYLGVIMGEFCSIWDQTLLKCVVPQKTRLNTFGGLPPLQSIFPGVAPGQGKHRRVPGKDSSRTAISATLKLDRCTRLFDSYRYSWILLEHIGNHWTAIALDFRGYTKARTFQTSHPWKDGPARDCGPFVGTPNLSISDLEGAPEDGY